ncbi:hypothetical protein CWI37_1406p0010 [Hamiltosporidium tvaerminnensis]|uniref:Uncharacterized protein n=2 Tax=Hamiltosporidium tvaerminnensis TaxID=1176355 RepID=A0A4Q9KXY1_9MICR|nr:hypothetical protein LUQ84_002598 [Hamiltosporidium tvaerminnensis]TBT99260.1 hypothetical protein CWI37_1406p0010 [Hamiltosporidium tvaerminnensis]
MDNKERTEDFITNKSLQTTGNDTIASIKLSYASPDIRTFTDLNLKRSFDKIIEFLQILPKKPNTDCFLCQQLSNQSTEYTVYELIKDYSKAIFCISQHTEKTKDTPQLPKSLILHSIFLEFSVLNEIAEFPLSVQEILNESLNTTFNTSMRDQLVATSKSFVLDTSINIYCEQDIESLTYKIYKKAHIYSETTYTPKNTTLTHFETDLILFLLAKRKETSRFFKIFETTEKSLFRYKLALILTLNGDSEKTSEQLIKETERQNFIFKRNCFCKKCIYCETEDIQNFYSKTNTEYLSEILNNKETEVKEFRDRETLQYTKDSRVGKEREDRDREGKDREDRGREGKHILDKHISAKHIEGKDSNYIRDTSMDKQNNTPHFSVSNWFETLNSYYDWLECIRIWNLNRDIEENVDTSMLDVCLKSQKFEEGWIIWETKKPGTDLCIVKICLLCVRALKNYKDCRECKECNRESVEFENSYEKFENEEYKDISNNSDTNMSNNSDTNMSNNSDTNSKSNTNSNSSITNTNNTTNNNNITNIYYSDKWVVRLAEVLRYVAAGHMKDTCCIITMDILSEIVDMEEGKRLLVLNLILEILCDGSEIKYDDEIVHVLMKGLLLLCVNCNDSKVTCEVCLSYADRVYNHWHKSRERGFFKIFFKPKMTCLSNKIFCDMLSLCECVKETGCFKKVLKDLIKGNEEINKDLCCRVEKYHRSRQCKCGLGVNDGKKLIKHVISEN